MAKFEIKFFDCTNEVDNFIIEKPTDVNLIIIKVNGTQYLFDKSRFNCIPCYDKPNQQ